MLHEFMEREGSSAGSNHVQALDKNRWILREKGVIAVSWRQSTLSGLCALQPGSLHVSRAPHTM